MKAGKNFVVQMVPGTQLQNSASFTVWVILHARQLAQFSSGCGLFTMKLMIVVVVRWECNRKKLKVKSMFGPSLTVILF